MSKYCPVITFFIMFIAQRSYKPLAKSKLIIYAPMKLSSIECIKPKWRFLAIFLAIFIFQRGSAYMTPYLGKGHY